MKKEPGGKADGTEPSSYPLDFEHFELGVIDICICGCENILMSISLSLSTNKSPSGGDAKSQKVAALPNYGFSFWCDERAEKRKEASSTLTSACITIWSSRAS